MTSCYNRNQVLQSDAPNLTDCMSERKNLETIKNIRGKIILVVESYLIETLEGKERYSACNLPEKFKNEGIDITFSLTVKEMYPNERLMATPALLIKIEKLEQ